MNGQQLGMTLGETELEMIPYVEGGELLMLWQLHREGLGNAVEITTGELVAESDPKPCPVSTLSAATPCYALLLAKGPWLALD